VLVDILVGADLCDVDLTGANLSRTDLALIALMSRVALTP